MAAVAIMEREEVFEGPAPARILTIRAFLDPSSIACVTNLFTQQGLVPAYLTCQRAGVYILIEVELAPEDGEIDEALLERVRALVCVDRANFVGRVC